MNKHTVYLSVIGTLFAGLAIVFCFFPRSKFSEVEKRELAEFPDFKWDKLWSGDYAKELGAWFSDSEPYRDKFMTASLTFQDKIALRVNEADAITIHAVAETGGGDVEVDELADNGELQEFHNTEDAKTKAGKSGTIVIGSAPNARALMIYRGKDGGDAFAKTINRYKEVFPDVNVYCMIIPSATEFYLPDKAKSMSNSMASTIKSTHSKLAKNVKPVDIYSVLSKHVDEPIYLRTDHHWAPLGAYYAARKFCHDAGVKIPDIKDYDKQVVHDFVGTMYGYSKDIAVKNSPEDFVYYTPKNAKYKTTYITYSLDKQFNITGQSGPVEGVYFHKFKDGASGAYSTFMGADCRITKVETEAGSGRRVLVLKDSFGNAVPGWFFESFDQVHVIDFRYFKKNMKKYVKENGITDILFCHNVFMAYGGPAAGNYLKFLEQ